MDEFLDLPQHILEFATTEEHNKREISVVGRSGCGLSINMKYVWKGTSAAENSGYFPACSAVLMLKIEARLLVLKRLCLFRFATQVPDDNITPCIKFRYVI